MSLSAMPLILRCTKTDHDRSSHDISALSGSLNKTAFLSGQRSTTGPPALWERSSPSLGQISCSTVVKATPLRGRPTVVEP